ncbi:MAG: HNH endonuclease [Candidatus Cloacimonadota bacterium]|nr:HNH endonuclease [Candidatus Cloacimonadota bacterium]
MKKDLYIYKKVVDWSTLNQGVSIPISTQIVFQKSVSNFLRRGDKKDIKIIVDNNKYSVSLINQLFDEKKYPNHKDILQIRYSSTSSFSKKLKQIFSISYNYLNKARNDRMGNKYVKTPSDIEEYLMFYSTEKDDVFFMDYLLRDDLKCITKEMSNLSELEFENSVNYFQEDNSANITKKQKLVKIRKLNRAIFENLKYLYNYKCQICEENFNRNYNAKIAEAHHIIPFTKTRNNDSDNILVLCPNHHRIIHKVNPLFDKSKLLFKYQNGFIEKIKLNFHL